MMKEEIKYIIKRLEYVDTYQNCSTSLNGLEIKTLLDYITNLQEEKEDYKSRCEKAIGYIKSPKICIDIRKTDGTLDFVSTDELENILNGGDE